MKSLSFKLGVILIGIAIFGYTEVWGADWKAYSFETTGTYHYYDEQSVMVISKNIVRVWTKTIFSEKDINEMIAKYGQGAKSIGHTRTLEEIDCKEKKIRILSLNFYSNEGPLLIMGKESDLKEFSEWNFIAPETIPESLYKAVCK